MAAADPHDLKRFLAAQSTTYDAALAELRAGRKRTHWMWFVLPQLAGLGHSPTARHFGIRSVDEARAYLAHPTLGPRYRACIEALQALPATSAEAVLGAVDALKLRSSLTLFHAASQDPLYAAALTRWAAGPDPATLGLLNR